MLQPLPVMEKVLEPLLLPVKVAELAPEALGFRLPLLATEREAPAEPECVAEAHREPEPEALKLPLLVEEPLKEPD